MGLPPVGPWLPGGYYLSPDPGSPALNWQGIFLAQQAALLTNAARDLDLIIVGTITRDANGAAISAPVVWPDGTAGTYTADAVSTAFPGAVDAYHVTYGQPLTKTYTQPAVTRNAAGGVTNLPAIVVT